MASSQHDRSQPVLITEAAVSQADQHAARKRRYAITMAIRAISLVLAALTYSYSLWLMAVFAVLGTVLPWIAVVMANDGPPKKRVDPNRYDARPDHQLEARPARIIEG